MAILSLAEELRLRKFIGDKKRKCCVCGKIKPSFEYSIEPRCKDGLRPRCRRCNSTNPDVYDKRQLTIDMWMNGMAWCGTCRKYKSIYEFHKDVSSDNGLCAVCKECNNRHAREYGVLNKKKISIKNKRRWRVNIDESRARSRKRSAKYNRLHPEKKRESSRLWGRRNIAKLIEYQRKWRSENREKYLLQLIRRDRRMEFAGDIDLDKLDSLLAHYAPDNKCMCCNKKCKLTIDHIVPVSKHGTSDAINLQFLCKSCNSSKHDKTIDYRPDSGKFAKSLK